MIFTRWIFVPFVSAYSSETAIEDYRNSGERYDILADSDRAAKSKFRREGDSFVKAELARSAPALNSNQPEFI